MLKSVCLLIRNFLFAILVGLILLNNTSFCTAPNPTNGNPVNNKEKESFRLADIVCSYVERLYVYPERIKPVEMLVEAMARLERIIPELLIDFEKGFGMIRINVDNKIMTLDTTNIKDLRNASEALKGVLLFVTNNKHDPKVSADDVMYEALNGMFSRLDPHSVVLPPKEFNEFKIGTSGQFGGIGMVVGIRDGMLTVISPIEGTPADRAGLKAGDQIIEIDGESTVNMSLTESVNKLRGQPNSFVTISVLKYKSTVSQKLTIERELIVIPTVSDKMLGDGIGYIKIRNFQIDTSEVLKTHIEELKRQSGNIKGMVIDLRNNSGGLLDQAIQVTDKFIDSGNIVITVGPGGKNTEIKEAKKSKSDELDFPIVLLIDASSASGAEIVVGALKENNRGVVIGDRTFGKGSVQQLIDLPDGAAFKLTMAKYLTPRFAEVQARGIAPDISFVPAEITSDGVILFSDHASLREEDLMENPDLKPKAEEPLRTIRYLRKVANETKETPEDKQPEFMKEDPYKVGNLSEDYLVQFAKMLINRTQRSDREAVLSEISSLLEEVEKKEEEKIFLALKEIGVDWSSGKTSVPPIPFTNLVMEYLHRQSEANVSHVEKIRAGEKLTLTVSISNKGKGTMYRVWGVTESENIYLDKLEFVFGKIGSGETRRYTKTIEIPKNAIAREDEVIIKFNELNGYAPSDLKRVVHIDPLYEPRFAYSYQISDRGGNGKEGNNDGLIQKGEDIDLVLFIKNTGQEVSEKTSVALRNVNEHDIFVSNGREEIDKLLPGETRVVELSLKVKKDVNFNEFSADILISEPTFGSYISETITFQITGDSSLPLLSSTPSTLRVLSDTSPVFGGRAKDSDQIVSLAKDAVIASDGWIPGLFRISLPFINKYGWIPSSNVERGRFDKLDSMGNIPIIVQHIPPSIELAMLSEMGLLSSVDKIALRGIIEDDKEVKHVYILVNNDKVYYSSGSDATKRKVANKINSGDREYLKKLEFTSDVQLKDGPNIITIVARDNEDLITRKSFVVTKRMAVVKQGEGNLVGEGVSVSN